MLEGNQYNESCTEKVVQTFMDFQDQDMVSKGHEMMKKATEAAHRSASQLRKLMRGVDESQSSSEVGSITGTCRSLKQTLRPTSKSCGASTADKGEPDES